MRFAFAPLMVTAAIAAAACGAPASQRASGPVAADVEASLGSGGATFTHDAWDALLAEGTRDGLVDYAYMAEHAADLDAYLARVAGADLGALAPPHLEALLINAYNALTVRAILDHPEVASIRDIDGVWTALEWTVGGHRLTLDNIEHNLLRPFFRDPRIHFVLNCASRSCAPLPPRAYTGEDLDVQLEERTQAFLTDPANVRLEGSGLRLSRYFDWYGDDFVAEDWAPRAESIPAFIARYAAEEVRAAIAEDPSLPISFTDYDWSLNAATPPPAEVRARGGRGVEGEADEGEETAGILTRFREWVAGFGTLAPILYGAGYVLCVVLLAPASTLTIGAGLTFGLFLGTVVVVIAANLGAALAFIIARYLLRSRVEGWLAEREKLRAVDRAVEAQGWRVVALTRLSPAFPFNVQNYFYGLTGVSLKGYVLASLFGMFPGTLLYVYIGAAGAEVASAAGGAASWGETVLLGLGLAATLLVVVLVTRVAKRELDRVTSDSGPGPGPATGEAGAEAGI